MAPGAVGDVVLVAWSNPNPSPGQQMTGQPTSYPASGPDQTYVATQDWYQAEAEASTVRPGEHRTPSGLRPGA